MISVFLSTSGIVLPVFSTSDRVNYSIVFVELWGFWIFGLWWPFWPSLAFFPWMKFLSKDQSLMINIKQNWAVSNNQMSKPISESKLPIYSTVCTYKVLYLLINGHWRSAGGLKNNQAMAYGGMSNFSKRTKKTCVLWFS